MPDLRLYIATVFKTCRHQEPQASKPFERVSMSETISYEDFSKLELRVGQIMTAEKVDGSDKLVKLTVDVGDEAPRTLVAGIGKVYSPDQLAGRKIIVLCNLAPKKLKGIESQGMLLAAGETSESLALLSPSHDMPVGTRVS